MDKVLVISGVISIVASLVMAVAAPAALARSHKRWTRIVSFAALCVTLWIVSDARATLWSIHSDAMDPGLAPEDALRRIRLLDATSYDLRVRYLPALFALLLATAAASGLGRLSAVRLEEKAHSPDPPRP